MQEDQHDRLVDLAPVYVIEGLSPVDRAVFENHLGACAACRAEVVQLREVAAILAQAAAAERKRDSGG